MSNFSFIDFYIGYPGHPRYRTPDIIEDDVVRVIVQKYEVIIFTNKGELLGDPNFGADLTILLHETRLSAETIEGTIKAQIADYIPEIDGLEPEGSTNSVAIVDDGEGEGAAPWAKESSTSCCINNSTNNSFA
jgi:hypothetical protein